MSDKDGNIDDLIREGFHSSDDGFDFGSWSDMEQKLDASNNLDQQIVQAFDQPPQELPVEAWPEISEELDIDTVWKRIDKDLTKKKRRAFIWWNAAAIGLLLLLAGYVFQDQFTGNDNPNEFDSKSTVLFEENENSQAKLDNGQLNIDSDLIGESNNENSNFVLDNSGIDQNGNINKSQTISSENIANDNVSLVSTNTANVSIDVDVNRNANTSELIRISHMTISSINPLTQPSFDHELPEIEITPLAEDKPLYSRKWVVGAFGSIDNSIISDATTREGLSKYSLVSNNFTVSANYGVFGQYYTRMNFFLQSEFYWNSKTRRSTQEYEHFRYIKHIIELDYYKLTLSGGKSIPFGKKKHTWFNPSAGAFVSYLKQGIEYQENTLVSQDSDHKQWNYGLQFNLGVQHEFNRLMIGYGVHSSIGLANIFEGTVEQSSALNVTRTYTNGLYLQVGFKL